MNRRAYQSQVLDEFTRSRSRFWALLWERQAGKSTTLADFALNEMLRRPNQTVIYASASLLLSQEITLKAAIRARQTVQQIVEGDATVLKHFADTVQSVINVQTKIPGNIEFKAFDSLHDREIKKYSASDFAELFKQQRLEFRVYHDCTSYSRTKVIAPNIATARSWSGTVLLDEVAFIRNLRELITALLPVISTDKNFKLILSTTPPEFDDTYYSFELLAPPAGLEFAANPAGNWYTSEAGVPVHRADAFDTFAAGKKTFDLKTGEVISPAEAFIRAPNKEGHRIAHWLCWMLGGSAAGDLDRLKTAQERGVGQCQNFHIDTDADLTPALNWLYQNLGHGIGILPVSGIHQPFKIGLGFDVATTTKGKSNPSVISIMEEHGPLWLVRARFIWRTRDPETANHRLESILDTLERRSLRPRALAQDATNERYYAEQNPQTLPPSSSRSSRRRLPNRGQTRS